MGQSQRERERGEEESKERGGAGKGTMSTDRERGRDIRGKARKCLWATREKQTVIVVLSHSAAIH